MKPQRSPVIGARDQASGLRNLFKGVPNTRALSLLVHAAPDLAPPLALGVARTLVTQGRRVLIIDETPLNTLREQPVPLYRVQYDLGQALTGVVGIGQVIKAVQPNLYFASAARIAKHLPHGSEANTLPRTLSDAGLEIDCLLIIAGTGHARHFAVYGSDQAVWLLSDVAHTLSESAVDALIAASADYQGLIKGGALPTLLVGDDQAYAGKSQKQNQFENLKKRYAQFSKLRPDYLGWINIATDAADPAIPLSMLQDLARRILV